MTSLRRLTLALTFAVAAAAALCGPTLLTASPAVAEDEIDPKKLRRLNRAAAGAFVTLMPAPPEDWRAGKTATDWRREGAQARRRYRHKEDGTEIAVTLEIRTRGLTYKKDLFDNPKRAAARGYKVLSMGNQKVLLRDSPVRREVRAWVDGRILVYMKGRGDVTVFEALVKAIDFDKLKEVK